MTYADNYNIRDKDIVKATDIANALDGLLVSSVQLASYVTAGGSENNTSSSTYTNLTATDLSVTVATGETVLFFGEANMSAGTTIKRAQFQVRRDTSAPTACSQSVGTDDGTGTHGYTEDIAVFGYDQPAAGTYTYRLAWRAVDSSIVYNRYGSLMCVVVQTGA